MTTNNNIVVASVKYVAVDLIGDILFFPVWWYSVGLLETGTRLYNGLLDTANNLALKSLFFNLFKPMFGQYDHTGRIISFFMRLFLLIGRLIYFVLKASFLFLALLLWVFTPIFVVYRILTSIIF